MEPNGGRDLVSPCFRWLLASTILLCSRTALAACPPLQDEQPISVFFSSYEVVQVDIQASKGNQDYYAVMYGSGPDPSGFEGAWSFRYLTSNHALQNSIRLDTTGGYHAFQPARITALNSKGLSGWLPIWTSAIYYTGLYQYATRPLSSTFLPLYPTETRLLPAEWSDAPSIGIEALFTHRTYDAMASLGVAVW